MLYRLPGMRYCPVLEIEGQDPGSPSRRERRITLRRSCLVSTEKANGSTGCVAGKTRTRRVVGLGARMSTAA